ncbi:para-nitrobenzyl esterase [Massarina eburnea CBS 473.64]|uniref:Para-nitrobenzyl esterase n=1 Tax=Massarina eburnea CBS 473.64 TaxID=1395130 RepID=A0A6A6S2L5_9PLEO|nr:para-nitrobenzyl esterase [Massarina eburnea CBS 473.64]
MTILKTPLGTFLGKPKDGVVQYLGIKYASLKDQLSAPELVTSYGTEVIDATSYGPRAPAIDACEYEQNVLIQQHIGAAPSPPMSGTECLNLNITIPRISDPAHKSKFPVMVFIHGGGFIMGSNHWSQYDPARLVRLSVELGMPIIAVNMNYRLGVLGNLSSTELREAGYPGNNSLRDQKCALRWIKKHISSFGGDAGSLTCFGESAGAAAVLYQLFSKEALFTRAISMSGTPIMLKPLPISVAEMTYGMVVRGLNLENASVDERIERLTTITPEDLVAKTPMNASLIPYLDGDIVPVMTSFKNLAAGGQELDNEGTIYHFMGLAERKSGLASAIYTSLTSNIGAEAAQDVLKAYNVLPTTSDNEAMKFILELGNDIAYYAPALRFAESFPGKTYCYHFDEPNPWDGPFKGCSTHLLDAAFLFQNFAEKMEERQREVGKEMAGAWIRFASGVEPWKSFEGADVVKTFGVGDANLREDGRRSTLFKLEEEGKVHLDKLSVAWDMFIASK